MTIDEAKQMISDNDIEKLKNVVANTSVNVNMNNKINNDILMQALCKAVSDDVIHTSSLDDPLVKLLNSSTNTISANKLCEILKSIRKYQKNIVCVITLKNNDLSDVINQWIFNGENGVKFNHILKFIIDKFEITPSSTRQLLGNTLKSTITNNMSQFISKFMLCTEEEQNELSTSINTIHRLVNMSDHILIAEFQIKK